jgi:hypothetical protein
MKKCFVLMLLVSLNAWGFDHQHQHFQEVLSQHVKFFGQQSLVDYKSLKQDSTKLKLYIDELSQVSKKDFQGWNREQQLATLINAYNAWTLKLIIDHYPVKSIRKIGPFYSTPWKQKFIKWLGEEVSLDEIEHQRIRKVYAEPRIHFVLVCASIGCPSLSATAFVAPKLHIQLDQAAKAFLSDRSKNTYQLKDNAVNLNVSSIFKWYGSDFGNEDELKKFLLKGLGIENESAGKKIKLDYLDYDWGLNEIK